VESKGQWVSLLRCRSGSQVIEFAVVCLAALTLIVIIIETSMQLTTIAVLEYAVREASRFGITGKPYPASMAGANAPASREASIAAVIGYFGMGLIVPSQVSVTLTAYSSFSAVGVVAGAAGAGASGAVVRYHVVYNQPFLTTLASGILGVGYLTHTATTVVKNENF
jgi:Flp pilus assembly protein TadG